jgi:Protein of unknown function (DUF2934)
MSTQSSPIENSANHGQISDADIAVRAYEKWQQRGCPLGDNEQGDWHAARLELEREERQTTLCEPAASVTPKADINDNIHVQLRNFVAAMLDETPRPTTRRIGSADMSLLRFRV